MKVGIVMQTRKVLHYDAFSSIPNKGNPAGIVLEADDLSVEDMQRIAKTVGFNETVFVLKSDVADYKLRYFTPGHEINLCGHATVGSMFRKLFKNEAPQSSVSGYFNRATENLCAPVYIKGV